MPPPALRLLGTLVALLLAALPVREAAAGAIVVKLRATGEHAVGTCAETAARSGKALRGATRDDSDSLDTLHNELEVHSVSALYRRADGRAFATVRADLRDAADAMQRARRAAPPTELPDLSHIYRFELGPDVDSGLAAARYAADPHVEWAQPDQGMDLDFDADDPFLFTSGTWGQPYGDLWGISQVRADVAWATSTGEGAVVAVVDTGLDYTHPDIVGNIWVNGAEDLDADGRFTEADRNGIDDDDNGFVDDVHGYDFSARPEANEELGDPDPWDDHGHGTHVSGTVAAVGGNGFGLAGVAPRARIMALKGFDSRGESRSSDLARAIVYAADNGADVINNSWSCSDLCPRNPIIDEAVTYAHGLGVVIVTSAGNHRNDVLLYSPENRRETIVVAATREDDSRAPFSGRGFLVDIAAPGSGRILPGVGFPTRAILSLLASGAPPGWSSATGLDVFVRKTGTSMSSPHVAGAAALLRGLHPDLTPDDVRAILRTTARDVDVPGHDRATGAGVLDAAAAVARAAPPGVRGIIAEPAPAVVLVPADGPLAVRGSASGPEFASYVLSVGRGLAPVAFEAIASSTSPIAEGTLGTWNFADVEDGRWLLRLEVTAADGERITEYLPIGVERTAPTAISSAGRNARLPRLDGDLLVWESAPSGDDELAPDDDTVRIAVADSRNGTETLLDAEGERGGPQVSGRHVVFVDFTAGSGGEIMRCDFDRRDQTCPTRIVGSGPGSRFAPSVSGDIIVWGEIVGTTARLIRCDVEPSGGCTPRVVEAAGAPVEIDFSDGRLLWRESGGFTGLRTCRLDSSSQVCDAQNLDTQGFLGIHFKPTVSDRLVAWEGIGFDGVEIFAELWVCWRQDDGVCPALRVAAGGTLALEAAVSGRGLVWSAPNGEELPSIYHCEYDRHTQTCPVQRLTSAFAPQGHPAIDGTRVVFEDGRDGASRIYAVDLPALRVFGSRQVRAGRWHWLAIAAHEPRDAAMVIEASGPGGTPIEDLGMHLHSWGERGAVLWWRPTSQQVGSHAISLVGRSERGLVTRETVELEVLPRRRRPAWRWPWDFWD